MMNNNDGNIDDDGNVDDGVGGITPMPLSLWHIPIPEEDNYDGFSLQHIPIIHGQD